MPNRFSYTMRKRCSGIIEMLGVSSVEGLRQSYVSSSSLFQHQLCFMSAAMHKQQMGLLLQFVI